MIGQTLGHYRILEKVGAGGTGVVYRARDEQLDREVAVKVLHSGALNDDTARKHFRKEALALAKLNHPNIGTVYEFDTQEGIDFLVMEYFPGKTLANQLVGRTLPEKDVIALGIQIASALEEAHEHGIVHRDLKPGNIAITAKGSAKVLDFGLAKLLHTAEEGPTEVWADSQAGAGTLPYMPPEQLQGQRVDARADIYTIGAVLYEMAAGRRAFKDGVITRLVEAILHQPPTPIRALNSRISPELDSIILKCLDKDPGRRYQSAKELLVDLHRLQPTSSGNIAVPVQVPYLRGARKWIVYTVAVFLTAAVSLTALNTGGWRDRLLGRTRAPQIRSLAVLPFENLSGDPNQDYFADGMTEALITNLGQLQALRVISRTSTMRYKSPQKRVDQIAQELNVDAIVEGSVSRSDGLARVTARLVYGPTDTQLWSRSYQRDLQNVLVLQAEVASAIASEIHLTLTPLQQAQLTRSRTVNPAAHEAYLKGNYLRWGTLEQRLRSKEYFEEAIRIDPNYAPAYAGLANYYLSNSDLLPRVTMPQARQYAQKALDLDPALADAHLVLGAVHFFGDRDWAGADSEFKRAIELNPGDSEARRAYSTYLSALGRKEEAQAEVLRAQELDPLYIVTQVTSGWVFYFARQYDKAAEQCQKALELDPNSAGAYDCIGLSYLARGMYDRAIAACQQAVKLSGNAPSRAVGLGESYAAAGRKSEAEEVLRQLRERSTRTYVSPIFLARLYLASGDREQALQRLNEAYQGSDYYLVWLNVERAFDPLRTDPRFQELLAHIGAAN